MTNDRDARIARLKAVLEMHGLREETPEETVFNDGWFGWSPLVPPPPTDDEDDEDDGE